MFTRAQAHTVMAHESQHNRETHKAQHLEDEAFDPAREEQYVEQAESERPEVRLHGLRQLLRLVAQTERTSEPNRALATVQRMLMHHTVKPAELELLTRIAVAQVVRGTEAGLENFAEDAGTFVARHAARAVEALAEGSAAGDEAEQLEGVAVLLLQAVTILQALEGNTLQVGPHTRATEALLKHGAGLKGHPRAGAALLRCVAATTDADDAAGCEALSKLLLKQLRSTGDAHSLAAAVRAAAMAHEEQGAARGAEEASALDAVEKRLGEVSGGPEAHKQLVETLKLAADVMKRGEYPTERLTFGGFGGRNATKVEVNVTSLVQHEVLEALRAVLGDHYYGMLQGSQPLAEYFGTAVRAESELTPDEANAERHGVQDARRRHRDAAQSRAKQRKAAREAKERQHAALAVGVAA